VRALSWDNLFVSLLKWIVLGSSLLGLCGGCTRIELQNKAEAYNSAIAESSNESILLNAVRASQRAPMSFVAFGQVLATPTFSGSVASTSNFDPVGLTTASITPTLNIGGGFNTFTMDNLNTDAFMEKMRKPVDLKLIRYFEALKWPEELMELLFIASIKVSPDVHARIMKSAANKCTDPMRDDRTREICQTITEQEGRLRDAQCRPFRDEGIIFNTARDICGMFEFQLFIRKARLLRIRPLDRRHFTYTPRSPLGMLYYLGELVAAQNYSIRPYDPVVLIGSAEGYRLVPLFVVNRGTSAPAGAAVRVSYDGESFYVPKPELGTTDEARSLQVLDFVSQVISVQTTSTDIPKVGTVGIISMR
jgi:hypothetical protein